MRIVSARGKLQSDFPPVELCCDRAIELQRMFYGVMIKVDLDDIMAYDRVTGHCGQELPYRTAVMVVESEYSGDDRGYVPFDLIDIDEAGIQ
jgi:hypothetical protein